jgi:hypothetical protein
VISLNHETEGISGLRELADCRNITDLSRLSVQGTSDCAALENDRPDSLLALLVNDSSLLFGLARAYQTFSEENRKDTEIFKDLESALAWLSPDEQEKDRIRDFIAKAQL